MNDVKDVQLKILCEFTITMFSDRLRMKLILLVTYNGLLAMFSGVTSLTVFRYMVNMI
mgnify:FL=1